VADVLVANKTLVRRVIAGCLLVCLVIAFLLHVIVAANSWLIVGKSGVVSDEVAGLTITGAILGFVLCAGSAAFEFQFVPPNIAFRALWRMFALVVFLFISVGAGLVFQTHVGDDTVVAAVVFDIFVLVLLAMYMIMGVAEPMAEDVSSNNILIQRPTAVFLQMGLLVLLFVLWVIAFIFHLVLASMTKYKGFSAQDGTGMTGLLILFVALVLAAADVFGGIGRSNKLYHLVWHTSALLAYVFINWTIGTIANLIMVGDDAATGTMLMDVFVALVLLTHIFTFKLLNERSAGVFEPTTATSAQQPKGQYGAVAVSNPTV